MITAIDAAGGIDTLFEILSVFFKFQFCHWEYQQVCEELAAAESYSDAGLPSLAPDMEEALADGLEELQVTVVSQCRFLPLSLSLFLCLVALGFLYLLLLSPPYIKHIPQHRHTTHTRNTP